MDRFYKNPEKASTELKFFVGKEIEKTKFFGENTLFVVGNQSTNDINQTIIDYNLQNPDNKITHIYFTANHTFETFDAFDQLFYYIEDGMNVTYECPVEKLTMDLRAKLPLNEVLRFCLMLSVVVPRIDDIIDTAVLKVDDSDTNRKNPGVWCHDLKDLTSDSKITLWSEYGQDEIL